MLFCGLKHSIQQQLGLYGAIVRWRFYHFAQPQIKLNWIKRPVIMRTFNSYIQWLSCSFLCVLYLHLISLSVEGVIECLFVWSWNLRALRIACYLVIANYLSLFIRLVLCLRLPWQNTHLFSHFHYLLVLISTFSLVETKIWRKVTFASIVSFHGNSGKEL